jgi:hypothetical protein
LDPSAPARPSPADIADDTPVVNPPVPALRLATSEDAAAIEALMKASIASIFPGFYDARQTEASIRYVGVVDPMLEVLNRVASDLLGGPGRQARPPR